MKASPAAASQFRWAGAAVFAASLGYFLFSYAVPFGEIAIGVVTPDVVAIDIALFSAFALHHSIFAREPVRAWVARTCAPHLERSVYVWVASLAFILVCVLWRPVPGVAWELRGPAAWLLPLLQVAGVWLTLRSAAIIDVWELAGIRQARRISAGESTPNSHPPGPNSRAATTDSQPPAPKPQRDNPQMSGAGPVGSWEFRTQGPYGWVRHPIYLGWLLIVLPMATMTMTRLVFAVTSTVYILIGMEFEERSLRSASGGAYDVYMRTVRWKLIPGLY